MEKNIDIQSCLLLHINIYLTWQKSAVDLRGDCKPFPHNVKLVNFKEHYSQKLLETM